MSRAAATSIPHPDSISSSWLSTQLQRAGHDAEVLDFSARTVGTGQIGKCIRFELQLAPGAADEAPRSLIGKFPSDDPMSRAAGVQLRNYRREVGFYRHLAERLDISTPRCYYAEIEGDGPEFALLLQDMRPAEAGDQLAGCTPDVAESAVLELAGLQAPSWNDASLHEFDWLAPADLGAGDDPTAAYRQMLPAFLERYRDGLSDAEARLISAVGSSPQCPLFIPVGVPFCLEHVDYRLDNLLIDRTVTPPRVTAVDWQSIRLGKPLNDVAYFLGAGPLPEVRAEVEQDIVRRYHAALQSAGVSDYPWDDCWDDYRRGTFCGLAVTVIASMLVQQTPRGDAMFLTMARRHARHVLDLGADEFLDG